MKFFVSNLFLTNLILILLYSELIFSLTGLKSIFTKNYADDRNFEKVSVNYWNEIE